MTEDEPQIDMLARILAGNAGLEWDRLGNYPGYLRNLWREQARAVTAAMALPPEVALKQAARR